jgi:hypothetical protein
MAGIRDGVVPGGHAVPRPEGSRPRAAVGCGSSSGQIPVPEFGNRPADRNAAQF